jgi:hypothetical protein
VFIEFKKQLNEWSRKFLPWEMGCIVNSCHVLGLALIGLVKLAATPHQSSVRLGHAKMKVLHVGASFYTMDLGQSG